MEQKLAALDAINFTELSGKIEEAVLRLAADHNTVTFSTELSPPRMLK